MRLNRPPGQSGSVRCRLFRVIYGSELRRDNDRASVLRKSRTGRSYKLGVCPLNFLSRSDVMMHISVCNKLFSDELENLVRVDTVSKFLTRNCFAAADVDDGALPIVYAWQGRSQDVDGLILTRCITRLRTRRDVGGA